MDFSAEEKRDEARREIKMRRKVYPHWVAIGRITQAAADRQLALMEAIAADYEAQVGNLFSKKEEAKSG